MRRFIDFRGIEDFVQYVDHKYHERELREQRLQSIYGNRKKKSIMYRIDRMIDYSGLRRAFPKMNAELFIGVIVMILFISCLIWYSIVKTLFLTMILSVGTLFVLFVILYMLTGIYFNKLEASIMTFLNLIENFSKTQEDINQIFRKTIVYLEQPFTDLLTDFCCEVEGTGDINLAFDHLIQKIEHRKCREIIRNLQVCSRYESNYGEVVKDCRKSMMDYLCVKSERKAIIMNGRAEIIILLLSSFVIILLFSNITSNLYSILLTTFIGNCILGYCFCVVLICIIIMIAFDKNGG